MDIRILNPNNPFPDHRSLRPAGLSHLSKFGDYFKQVILGTEIFSNDPTANDQSSRNSLIAG